MVVVSHVDVGRWIGDGDAEGGCRVSDVKPSCAAPCLPQSLAVRILKLIIVNQKYPQVVCFTLVSLDGQESAHGGTTMFIWIGIF